MIGYGRGRVGYGMGRVESKLTHLGLRWFVHCSPIVIK